MQKIISLFKRNYDGDRLVRDEVTPGAEWVINGEGVATRKWDGTCCKIENGILFKRYDAKKGRVPPVGFIPAQDPDPITGHWPGWLAVPSDGTDPADKYHREAFLKGKQMNIVGTDGTYELIGPKINGNKEGVYSHYLIPHGEHPVKAPRMFEELKAWFLEQNIEGVVWHHPDGRMVKIKKKDFGYKW